MVVWLDKYMSRSASNLWLDVNNFELYKAIDLKYISDISSVRYEIENYVISRPSAK